MNCICQNQRVFDPAQRDLFTQMEVRSKYADGYETGLNWDASWMPGGPWVYRARGFSPSEHCKHKERESVAEHQAWMDGFHDGLKIRLTNEHFAKWWDEHRTMTGHYRYIEPCENS